ncbi:hypothetical protein, partial [Bartonella vinsonii]
MIIEKQILNLYSYYTYNSEERQKSNNSLGKDINITQQIRMPSHNTSTSHYCMNKVVLLKPLFKAVEHVDGDLFTEDRFLLYFCAVLDIDFIVIRRFGVGTGGFILYDF